MHAGKYGLLLPLNMLLPGICFIFTLKAPLIPSYSYWGLVPAQINFGSDTLGLGYYFFLVVYKSALIGTTLDVIFRYAYKTKEITYGVAFRFASQLAVTLLITHGGFVEHSSFFGSTLVGLTFGASLSSAFLAAYVWVWMDPDDGSMDFFGFKTVIREMLNHDKKGGRD